MTTTTTGIPETFSAIQLVNKSAVEVIHALADAVMANQIDLISTAYYNSNEHVAVIKAEWVDLTTDQRCDFKIIKWKTKGLLTAVQERVTVNTLIAWGVPADEAFSFVKDKPPVNKETENG